jgi:acetyl esterase
MRSHTADARSVRSPRHSTNQDERVPLHPTAELMVKALADAGMTFTPDTTPESRRAKMHALAADPSIPRHPVGAVDDLVITGPGGAIPARRYAPPGRALDDTMLLWFHGGGWVTGDLDTHDQVCRLLCAAASLVVVSVEYRLAPEAKFPAAADDCLAAYEWALTRAGRVVVGGDSAGGNLAAVVALDARERGLPQPALQILVYPVTDYELDSPAMVDNATGYFLEADSMRWFWGHYARDDADFADWRFSPLRAADHSGLAPAIVITAQYDPLRDQGAAYAARLRAAGVPTEYLCAEGLIHGFFGLHAFMPPAEEAWQLCVGGLQAACGSREEAV